jgi:hypothetical protein
MVERVMRRNVEYSLLFDNELSTRHAAVQSVRRADEDDGERYQSMQNAFHSTVVKERFGSDTHGFVTCRDSRSNVDKTCDDLTA